VRFPWEKCPVAGLYVLKSHDKKNSILIYMHQNRICNLTDTFNRTIKQMKIILYQSNPENKFVYKKNIETLI